MKRAPTVWSASTVLIGSMIGAGVFALPRAFASVGVLWGTVLFACVAGIICWTHILFADICCRERERHRLVGYARSQLGAFGYRLALVSYPWSVIGAHTVYILLGGLFGAELWRRFGGGDVRSIAPLVFWLVGAFFVLRGLSWVARFERYAACALVMTMVLLSSFGWSQASVPWISSSPIRLSLFLAPFGVFLFALYGLSAIGEVCDLVGRDPVSARRAVIRGTIIAALLSWFFGVSLAWVMPSVPSNDLSLLMQAIPEPWSMLLLLVGFTSVLMSFVVTAQDLKATFHLDLGWSKLVSWCVVFCTPLLIAAYVRRGVFELIGSIGAVFLGMNGMLVAAMASRRSIRSRNVDVWWIVACGALGLIYFFGLIAHVFIGEDLV